MLNNLWKSNYLRLVLLFTFFNWFIGFSRATLPPHFLKEGLTLSQIILGPLLSFCGTLIILLIASRMSHRLNSRLGWYLATALAFIYLLLLIKIASPAQFYLAYFINGLVTFFFYAFYNSAHFEATNKEHIGKSSALVFSIGPVISIFAPLAAGLLAQINYNFIWALSFFFFLIPLGMIRYQKKFSISYSIGEVFREVKTTRLFIFIGAFWEAMTFGIIPVYTLFFIDTPLGYGTFLAYLGLVSVAANLFLGTITDRMQKRIIFLYPVTLIMSFATFLFPLATSSIFRWIILAGIVQFAYPLYNSLSLSMVIDAHPSIRKAIVGREMVLSLGRIAGLSLVFLSFVFEDRPFIIFFILGTAILAFPLILAWRTRLVKSHAYL